MRQAGRYLPEYRATRQRAGSFLGLCKSPDYATEVTLQPLDRFPLDAAILFSDILTVPDAMGLGLYFADGEGPKFERPLKTEAEIKALRVPDIGTDLKYVTDAVTQIRKALDGRVPLIGFSGSPFTLSCYMVEGGGSDDYAKVKTLMYNEPKLMHHILDVTARAVVAYLNAQIEAGAQAVMIFDSWGGVLSHAAFHEFSLAYTRRILDGLIKEKTACASPPSCSPRVAVCGSRVSPTAAAMRWGWTGPWTSAWRVRRSATRSPCRATWIPPCCLPRRMRSTRKSSASSAATATAAAMCSTSATASRSIPTRNTRRRWLRRYMS